MDDVAAMGGGEVLDLAAARAERIRSDEVDLLKLAYQWAVLHPAESLDPEESKRSGREGARLYGGVGTPEVTEFAAAEFGARIGRTTHAAAAMIADALDLHRRGGRLWERVEAGEVRPSYARHVVTRTRSLPVDQAIEVADAVAESADGRIAWTRFEAQVEAAVALADPEAAREREQRARAATFAKKLRGSQHGMASLLIRAPLPVIEQITAIITSYSTALAEDLPHLTPDERDVQALLLLLTPGSDRTPDRPAPPVVNLYVHTYLDPDTQPGSGPGGGMARIEGHGMVSEAYLRDVLGPTCRFKVHPVIDIPGMAPVDAYEIPRRHRQAVHLMTPADVFPWGSCTTRTQQIDHTTAHQDGGVTGVGNYGPMTTRHHRIKTHGRWQVQQPFPGIYLWRDQYGAVYLVDNTGTRALGRTTPAPVVIEIYRDLPRIDLDFHAA